MNINKSQMDAMLAYKSAGEGDLIYQPFYDSIRIERGPFRHTFYCVPVGQKEGDVTKTHEDTNMYLANQLVMGQEFYITGLGVFFCPDIDGVGPPRSINIRDALHVLSHGYLRFVVGMRQYLGLAPLGAMPPQFPMYWYRDDATLEQIILNPSKAEGEGIKRVKPFEMVPIFIPKGEQFYVEITMDNAFKLETVGKLGVMLDGFLIRPEI